MRKLTIPFLILLSVTRILAQSPVEKSIESEGDRLREYLSRLGPILSFEPVRIQAVGEHLSGSLEVQFGSMTVALEVVRAKDGKISRFEMHPE